MTVSDVERDKGYECPWCGAKPCESCINMVIFDDTGKREPLLDDQGFEQTHHSRREMRENAERSMR